MGALPPCWFALNEWTFLADVYCKALGTLWTPETRACGRLLKLTLPLSCLEENLLKPQDHFFNSFCVLITYTKVQVFK